MLLGHEKWERAFARLAAEGELPHACLFFGDDHVGKASFAVRLAALVERGAFGDGGPLVDFLRVAPNAKGNIGVDEARETRRFLWQTPLVSPRRFALVDGADALTDAAQAALLKIVEEPPAHGMLVFVGRDPGALAPALASRLQKIRFGRVSPEAVESFLAAEKGVPPAEAAELAARSFGRVGMALRMREGTLWRDDPETGERVFADEVRERMAAVRGKRPKAADAAALAWLAGREEIAERFNANRKLQKKAMDARA